jgi:hypothetical protein
MLATTPRAFRAILESDPTVTPQERNRLLTLLRDTPPATSTPAQAETRIIRRRETARLLGRSVRAVDRLCTEGLLNRVKWEGRTRSPGFRLDDVHALIAGQSA